MSAKKILSPHLWFLIFLCLFWACGGSLTNSRQLPCLAQGMTVVCYAKGCLLTGDRQILWKTFNAWGLRWITLIPQAYLENLEDSSLEEALERSPSLQELKQLIVEAKQQGLSVFLKPHVELLDGTWRGELRPLSLQTWKNSYRDFILTYARLAQSLNVEIFSVGTELESLVQEESFWRDLSREIRGVYGGQLTYAANWSHYAQVPFWDALDFIGIDFYFPLSSPISSSPSATEIQSTLLGLRSQLAFFSRTQQKNILITEVGYRSVDGGLTRPYDFKLEGAVDEAEQALGYTEFLKLFRYEEDWLEGIFWWSLDPALTGGPLDKGYSPYQKQASQSLEQYWGGTVCSPI